MYIRLMYELFFLIVLYIFIILRIKSTEYIQQLNYCVPVCKEDPQLLTYLELTSVIAYLL